MGIEQGISGLISLVGGMTAIGFALFSVIVGNIDGELAGGIVVSGVIALVLGIILLWTNK